jgi:hypothetical protein
LLIRAENYAGSNANDVNSSGIVRGWGVIDLDSDDDWTDSRLKNHGAVIADGGGQDHTLDLSSFDLILDDDAISTVTQAEGTQSGWYAVDGGKLLLPTLTLPTGNPTLNWAEQADDTQINLVNSVTADFTNVTTGGDLIGELLAYDRSDAPSAPAGAVAIGMWQFTIDAAFDDATVTFRYDDVAASDAGIAEADLGVFYHDGANWIDVTSSIDTTNHLITSVALGDDDSTVTLAVGIIPEPGTLGLLLSGTLALAVLRRRDSTAPRGGSRPR